MEHLWRLRAFAFGSAWRVISARWMWSRLWSFAFKTPAAASENVAGSVTRVARPEWAVGVVRAVLERSEPCDRFREDSVAARDLFRGVS